MKKKKKKIGPQSFWNGAWVVRLAQIIRMSIKYNMVYLYCVNLLSTYLLSVLSQGGNHYPLPIISIITDNDIYHEESRWVALRHSMSQCEFVTERTSWFLYELKKYKNSVGVVFFWILKLNDFFIHNLLLAYNKISSKHEINSGPTREMCSGFALKIFVIGRYNIMVQNKHLK